MKFYSSFTIIAITCITKLFVCVEAAGPMWSAECSPTTNFSFPIAGGDYEGIGCHFLSMITTVNLAGISPGAGASMLIRDGLSSPSSGIWVVCPPTDLAATRGPFHMTVQNMRFGESAALKFTGALSPGSSLLIANNTFRLAEHTAFVFWSLDDETSGIDMVAAVLIGSLSDSLTLDLGSTITIMNNTISAASSVALNVIGICVLGAAASINRHSAITISNNTFINSTVACAYVVYFRVYNSGGSGNSLSIDDHSALTMSGNSLRNSRVATTYVSYIYLGNQSSSAVSTSNYSLMDMSHNAMSNCTVVAGSNSVARLLLSDGVCTLSLSIYSNITMNGNLAVDILASSVFYVVSLNLKGVLGSVSLDGRSAVALGGNRISSSVILGAAYVAAFELLGTGLSQVAEANNSYSLDGNSNIALDNNTMDGSQASAAYVGYLHGDSLLINTTCDLSNSSSISLSNNHALNSSTTSIAYVSYLDLSSDGGLSSIHLSGHSVISFRHNTLRGGSVGSLGYTAYIQLQSPYMGARLILRSQSLFSMERNLIHDLIHYIRPVAYLAMIHFVAEVAALDLDESSTVTMSHNGVSNCSLSSTYVVYLCIRSSSATDSERAFTTAFLQSRSSIVMSNNYIHNSTAGISRVASWYHYSSRLVVLRLSGWSRISISNNSFITCVDTSLIYAALLSLDSVGANLSFILDTSTVTMSNNVVKDSKPKTSGVHTIFASYLTFSAVGTSSLAASNMSNISLSENAIWNCSSQDAFAAYVYVSGSWGSRVFLQNRSVIALHTNLIAFSSMTAGSTVVYFSMFASAGNARVDVGHISTIDVSSNSMQNGTSLTYYNVFLRLKGYRTSFSIANHSALIVRDNFDRGNNFRTVFQVYIVFEGLLAIVVGDGSLSVVNHSSISIANIQAGGAITNNGDYRAVYIVTGGVVALEGASSILVCNVSAAGVAGTLSTTLVSIQATQINVRQSSNITIKGCQLFPALAQPSSLLSIDSFNKSILGTMSLTAGGSLSVADNTIAAAEGSIANISLKVYVDFSSTLVITRNSFFVPANKTLLKLHQGLHLNGSLSIDENTLSAPNLLVVVGLDYSNGDGATLSICGNRISQGDGTSVLAPAQYRRSALWPAQLANLATSRCPGTASTSTTATLSAATSHSKSLYPTRTASHTLKPVVIRPVPAAVETAAKVRDVAGVAVAVTAVASITGGQLGVANAMLRLADCSASSDGGELPIIVHPLRFSFGDRKYQRNAAGAVSDTLLVPLIVVAIALGPARLLIMWSRSLPSRAALVQMGWPTLLVLPFANLAEGIGVTTVASLGSGEPFGVCMGVVALLVLLAFAGSWAWILARVVPRSRLQLVREEGAAGLVRRRAFLRRMVRPSHRWVPLAPAEDSNQKRISFSDVERYGNAIGDKQWYYAEFLSFLCSLAVGVCEGLPPSLCRERAVIALVPSLLQCGLAVLALIPLERFLQSLLALCLVPMYVVVGVKVFSDSASDELLDTVMAVLSTGGNVIGLVIMSLGLAAGLWEIVASHRRKKRRLPSSASLSTPMLDIEVVVTEPEQLSSAENPTYSSDELLEQIANETVDDPPSTTVSRSRPLPQRPPPTMAEVLDYVEQVALTQRLDAELL